MAELDTVADVAEVPDQAKAEPASAEEPKVQDAGAVEQETVQGEEFNNKRKFEDNVAEEGDGPMRKRPSFDAPEAAVLNGNIEQKTENLESNPETAEYVQMNTAEQASAPAGSAVYECPSHLVGKLIGRQGATIQELQARSDTRIQVDHKTPGDVKQVHITGAPAAVENAKQMIKEVLEAENPVLSGGETSKVVSCPPGIVGRIIGKGGETIRSLQQSSGAHIVVDQNFPEGVDRVVNVTGRGDAVDRACKMITELIAGTPGSAQAIIQKHGLGITRHTECGKSIVGRIIGKAGETIKGIQKQTGANIQIDQNTDPCSITVSGKREAVDHAMHLLTDIIRGTNQFGNDFQGPAGGGPYGRPGFSQQPYQQYPASGPAAAYPPAFPYGAPAPAPGGYGFYGAPGYAPAYQAAPPQQYGYQGYNAGADPYQSSYGGNSGYGAAGNTQSSAQSVWQEQHDDQGRPYYYNTQTGVSQWEKPAEMQ